MYWGNPEKTRDTFRDGWTKSGDKYSRDADGYYTYAGRSDDMLKVSGIYVSPFEVEATLMQHPAVLEAAVIGKEDADGPDQDQGLRGAARTASRPTDDELKAFVKERLAPYKYPRFIEFVDELPKTATGKIQRFRLRERESSAVNGPAATLRPAEFADHPTGAARDVRIEYRAHRARAHRRAAARLPARGPGLGRDVEGLSRSSCASAGGFRGLVFSRPGYGRSTPRDADETLGRRLHAPPGARGAAGLLRRASASTRSPGSSATATAARSRCCTRRAFPTRSRAWSCWRRTSSSRT